MAKKNRISKDQRTAEGKWLQSLIDQENKKMKAGYQQKDLAAELEINSSLVSRWVNGNDAIPDYCMAWIGRRFNVDVVKMRPSMDVYADYFLEKFIKDMRLAASSLPERD